MCPGLRPISTAMWVLAAALVKDPEDPAMAKLLAQMILDAVDPG